MARAGIDSAGGTTWQADLCIVGAGAAGIAIALAFAGTPNRVILVESGGTAPAKRSQDLCAGEVINPDWHYPPARYRRRCLGGSTVIWGGRCVPLDAIDFLPRPWLGLHDPWPVAFAELLPYWRRAHAMCALGDFTYDGDEAIAGGMLPLIAGLSSAKITTQYIERFSQPTDFGTAYRARLTAAPNIQVMLNSTCVGITLSDSLQRVDHIVIARDGQPRQRIHARAFVLATGGLEVPRLLLASRGQQNCGVGNRSKLVGRHYMCHLAAVTGSFLPAPGQAVARGYQRSADGVYCRRRFSVKAAAQAEAGIGNAIARLHQPRLSDPAHRCGPMSAIYLARHLLPFEYSTRLAEGNHRARFWPHAGNVARDPINTMLFGLNYLTQRRFARRKLPSLVLDPAAGPLTFDVHAEQLPNPASRITLGEQVDRFGMPVLKVDWRYLPADIATVRGTLALIGQSLSEGGHGSASFDMDALEADLLRERAYGGHHLGTARMSDSPRTGVVDRACRVHGLTNLYIASGAVFPTSGQANPTLTIVALALRLSDHLKRILASEHTAVASRLLAAGRAVSAAA